MPSSPGISSAMVAQERRAAGDSHSVKLAESAWMPLRSM
jgi:hypothetical protein